MPENIPLITETVSGRVKTLAVKTAPKSILDAPKARNPFLRVIIAGRTFYFFCFFICFFIYFFLPQFFFIPAFLTEPEQAGTGAFKRLFIVTDRVPGPKLTEQGPGQTVRIILTENDKFLLSENKIVTRRLKRTRKNSIITKAKVKMIAIIIVAVLFVNIYCFVILTYPISPIFIF